MFEDYDFGYGVINKYIDFDIDLKQDISEQIFSLKEDMLQITYKNGLVLDVGWYPEFEPEGFFNVSIIKNLNWENPEFRNKCATLEDLYSCLDECVKYVSGVLAKE